MVLADCISLIKGPIVMDVRSCGVLKPEMTFDTNISRFGFIKDLPKKEQQVFWNSYRGMIIKGRVAGSEAVRSGLTAEKGALNGEEISVFVHPGSSNYGCQSLTAKRVKATLNEACCEGGGNPPCLLNSTFVLHDIAVIGGAGKVALEKRREQKKTKSQLIGEKYLQKRDFKKAAIYLNKASRMGKLDLTGHYKLALAYRLDDRCPLAVEPLQYIAKKVEKKEFWADDEIIIRRATMLLARCYAMMNRPGFAVTALEGFLLEPRKYRREIQQSLSHKDFGWIKTSKEYRDYMNEAQQRLNQQP